MSQSMGACGGGSSSGGISSHPNSNSSSSSGSGRTLVVCNVIGGSGSRGGKVIYPCSNCGTVHRQYHGGWAAAAYRYCVAHAVASRGFGNIAVGRSGAE